MRDRRKNRRRLSTETLEIRRCLAASLGWDGPGQGSADLSYYVGDAPAGLSQAAFESAIETALDAWSDVIDVDFTQTSQPNLRDSIDFEFTRLDGSRGTLAQAYLPDDVNPARIAGDIEFDIAENWEIGNAQGNQAFDLTRVAVHEIGHALGIDHLDIPGSVMAPFVSPSQVFTSLAAVDVDAALEVYAPASPTEVAENTNETETVIDEPTSVTINDDNSDDDSDGNETTEDDTPDRNRRWRPWLRFFWSGNFWARFGSRVIASPGQHNPLLPADVNQDNSVSASDALSVINQMSGAENTDLMADTNGDGAISASDALFVINEITRINSGGLPTASAMVEFEDGASTNEMETLGEEEPVDTDDSEQDGDSDEGTPDVDDTGENDEEGSTNTGAGGDSDPEPTPTEPTNPQTPVDPEVPATDPEEPATDPEEPATDPEEPATDPEEPATDPEEPATDPEEPATDPEEPATDPEEPATDPEEPATDPEEPATDPEEPATDPEEPATDPEEPATDPEEPATDPEEPTTDPESDADDHCPDGVMGFRFGFGTRHRFGDRIDRDGIIESLFASLDTSGDELLTADELSGPILDALATIDTDENGGLSLAEIEAFHTYRNSEFGRLDENADGAVTEDEVTERVWMRLLPADANEDGAVTEEELQAFRDAQLPRGFSVLDDNSDGLIMADEVSDRIWQRLAELDSDQDTAISPEEFANRGDVEGEARDTFRSRPGRRGFRFRS